MTGRPVPGGTEGGDREAARARLGVAPGGLRARIRRFPRRAAAERGGGRRLRPRRARSSVHASGHRDYDELRRRLDELGSPAHYRLFPYIEPFADALAAADIAAAAPAARCSSWRRPDCRRFSCPTRTRRRPPDRERPLHGEGRRGGRDPGSELDGPRLAREVAACWGRHSEGGDGEGGPSGCEAGCGGPDAGSCWRSFDREASGLEDRPP